MSRKTKNAVATLIEAVSDTSDAIAAVTTTPTAKTRKRRTTTPKANKHSASLSAVHSDESSSVVSEKPISGKLGVVATAVSKPGGATLGELTETTGWQPHTVRAALTRLRQRGIDAKLKTIDDRKVYQAARAEA